MKKYQIKNEYIDRFGSECPANGIITAAQLEQCIEYWTTEIDTDRADIMNMVYEI